MPNASYHGTPQRASIAAWSARGMAEQMTRFTEWSRSSGEGGVLSISFGITPRQ